MGIVGAWPFGIVADSETLHHDEALNHSLQIKNILIRACWNFELKKKEVKYKTFIYIKKKSIQHYHSNNKNS